MLHVISRLIVLDALQFAYLISTLAMCFLQIARCLHGSQKSGATMIFYCAQVSLQVDFIQL